MRCGKTSLTLLTFSDEPRLVDVAAVDDRTSDASVLSTRRSEFRANVIERDGTCVLTGNPARQCIACHIIPHAKGSNVRPYESSIATFSLDQVHVEPHPSPR